MALGAVICLLFGTPSFAATVNVGDTILFSFASGHLSGFNGGAFTVNDTTSGFQWNSFCVEMNEYINLSGEFSVASVGSAAINGGLGNSGSPGPIAKSGSSDPISSQTAFLYYKYATGTITGITGAGTGAQQKALQNVFWYLENEIASLPTDSDGFGDTYLALANTAEAGKYYGVAVVNPTYPNGTLAQSQLVYVPEAGALLLFGTRLGWSRRVSESASDAVSSTSKLANKDGALRGPFLFTPPGTHSSRSSILGSCNSVLAG